MTILDRMALAMVRRTAEHYGDAMPVDPDLSLTRLLAIAALEAAREPTVAMNNSYGTDLEESYQYWTHMIDAALAEAVPATSPPA